MERLSSCYFCGDAVDATVAEYPLVDTDAHDVDTDHRIDLCSSCRRKLTEVIERVLSAAFNGEEPPEPDTAMAEVDDEMRATAVEAVDEDDTDGSPLADESEWVENGTAENGVEADRSTDETEATDDAVPAGEDETDAVGGASFRDDGGTDDAGSVERDETAESDDAGAAGDDPATTDAGEDEVAAVDESGEAGADAPDAEASDATDAGEGADTAVEHGDYEKAEFNKIVRLLQNREFPVEIDELVVVASSAYEIDEPTCHAVIAALVDRGVVEDRGDELVRN